MSETISIFMKSGTIFNNLKVSEKDSKLTIAEFWSKNFPEQKNEFISYVFRDIKEKPVIILMNEVEAIR